MKLYLEETYIEQKVAEVLADPSVTAFVAAVEDEIVGFSQMKEGPAESTVSGPNAVELQRLYVIAAYHGGGAANRLVRIALRWAADLDYRTVWLGVSATNFRAQKFYAKFGFTFCGKHTFMIGNDPQTDLLMEGPIVDAAPCGGAPDNPDHI